ncbi:Phosphate import ATP-binding protein PstB, partial [Frankliniella fusca]
CVCVCVWRARVRYNVAGSPVPFADRAPCPLRLLREFKEAPDTTTTRPLSMTLCLDDLSFSPCVSLCFLLRAKFSPQIRTIFYGRMHKLASIRIKGVHRTVTRFLADFS